MAIEETAKTIGFLNEEIVAFGKLFDVFAREGDGLRAGKSALFLVEDVRDAVAEEVGVFEADGLDLAVGETDLGYVKLGHGALC